MNRIAYLFLLVFLSCSVAHTETLTSNSKIDFSEKVSLQATIDVAMAAYVKGCADQNKKLGQKDFFFKCVKQARKHVHENILQILEQ